jgi:hypothetical protein
MSISHAFLLGDDPEEGDGLPASRALAQGRAALALSI